MSPSDPTLSINSSVTSRDGTSIGYYHLGNGDGIILLHGAGQTAESFRTLANELSSQFTVYVPDRRGRGMSPSYGDYQGLPSEVADLEALLDRTGARLVFGLSAGAVVAMETALVRPDITKLAVYEPPLNHDDIRHDTWAPRYERELSAGRPGRALAACLKGTSDRSMLRLVPEFLLGMVFDIVIRLTADRPVLPGTLSPRQLIPTIHYDIWTVTDAAGPLERFASLQCHVLLLEGSKSHRKLRSTVDDLHVMLPKAARITLHGVGHTSADNDNQPARVAAELRQFFA